MKKASLTKGMMMETKTHKIQERKLLKSLLLMKTGSLLIGSMKGEAIFKLNNGKKLKRLKKRLSRRLRMVNFSINFKLLALYLLHLKLKKDAKELFTIIELINLISLENKLTSKQLQNQQTLFGKIDNMKIGRELSKRLLFGS